MNDGAMDRLDSRPASNIAYSVQATNQYEIGSVFQCPVWVDLGDNNIADIASFLLAKGLDSGIPIEIKLRLSMNCLYIPLTIFGISVFLAVIFLGVLCFYTKTRSFKAPRAAARRNSGTSTVPELAHARTSRINPPQLNIPTNFLKTHGEVTTTIPPKETTSRGNTKSKSRRTHSQSRQRNMGEEMEQQPQGLVDFTTIPKLTNVGVYKVGDVGGPTTRLYQVQNPTIVRQQTSRALPLCGKPDKHTPAAIVTPVYDNSTTPQTDVISFI